MFNLVQQSYQAGWYTLDNVKTFVLANMLTKDEYKQITGQDYDQPQPAQLKHSRLRNTQYINKPHQCDGAFIMGGR